MRLLFISALLFLSLGAFAQTGYEIKVNIKEYTGDTCVLAFKMAEKTYIKDTALVQNGQMVFKGSEELPGGVYLVLMRPDNRYFEFILSKGDQHFSIETKGPDYVENMKIKGSKDNDLFYEYMQFLGSMNKKASPLRNAAEANKDKKDSHEYKNAMDELTKLDKDVKAKQQEIQTKGGPTSFTAKIIRCNQAIEIPDPPAGYSEDKKQEFRYRYYKSHFYDGFDWSDERFVRSPFLDQKLVEYLEKLTVSHPDSVVIACDYLLEQARKNKEVYKYVASRLLNYYAESKIICMDAVYVHVADKYYCDKNGPFGGAFWVDEAQLKKICDNANDLRAVRCGQLAPNLILNSLDGQAVELHKVKAEFVVVYFWDPDCGNCKKMSARLAELYSDLKAKGVEIYGICSKSYEDFDKCKKKVTEMGLNWINVGDPYFQARAKQLYDIKMTPFMYLLDKDKKIIYKRIDPDQLRDIINKEIEKKKRG